MKKAFILLLVALQFSCDKTQETNKEEKTSFDSSTITVKQYYLDDDLKHKGKLDTCTAKLSNDTLIIVIGTDLSGWPNGLKIKSYQKKHTGHFFHADDGGAYYTLKNGIVELDNLVIHYQKNPENIKQNGFKQGDTIQGWIFATSKLYKWKTFTQRDRFEGRFFAIIN